MTYDSWKNAEKVAVLGAGTMGGGIAAHLANLGFKVLLFDISEDAARAGLERTKEAKPPHFYDAESLSRIKTASIQDDLDSVADCDWVCEAVSENLEIKRGLFERLEGILREDAMVTTNTSGLQISLLMEGRSESFRCRFMGVHFFNPPRYLKLIELIPTAETSADAIRCMTEFLENRVGRRVVPALDTPGFIANRYGMWCLYQAIHTAEKLHLTVEAVDQITGPFLGRPKTGTFRLADLIGFDIMEDIAKNLMTRCENDPYLSTLQTPESLAKLIAEGRLGNKTGGGYYRREGTQFLVANLASVSYGQPSNVEMPAIAELGSMKLGERISALLERRDEVGEFIRCHIPPILEYAIKLGPEISHTARDFDRVMKWGWGWQMGPFELLDAVDRSTLAQHFSAAAPRPIERYYIDEKPYDFDKGAHAAQDENPRFLEVASLTLSHEGQGFKVREDGSGGVVVEFTTKMGVLNPDMVRALDDFVQRNLEKPITIANAGRAFSAGYDLNFFISAAESGNLKAVESALEDLQRLGANLRRALSSAAVNGVGLGGGLEVAMHCRTVVADPEALVGLPEALVGVVPAGGGTAILRMRSQHDVKAMVSACMTIAKGEKVPATAAKQRLFLRQKDVLIANPDQLLYAAIHADRAELPPLDWAPAPPPLAGMIDQQIQERRAKGEFGEYGVAIAEAVKHIFTKPANYQEALALEREEFLRLLGRPMTVARMKHMVETGKPLLN